MAREQRASQKPRARTVSMRSESTSPPPRPLRVMLIGHGYPPREAAGTEQHMAALARGLVRRGHEVTVLAATRDPTRPQYSWLEETAEGGPRVHRLVQNIASRPLAQAERDRAVEEAVARRVAELRPELVHVHHLQFLSSGLRFDAPTVLTLHDQWLWCAAGGLGLLDGQQPCPGPLPARCASCAAGWAPTPSPAARVLLGAAGRLSPYLSPPVLHRAFRTLPEGLRQRLQRPQRGQAPEPPAAAAGRNAAFRDFARAATLRIAPSRHLAGLAERHGLGPVVHVPHGVDGPPTPALLVAPDRRDGPFLFLGTIAAHKGPDLVVQAWRRAFPDGTPGLALHGPVGDARLALGHDLGAPLDRAGVWKALGRSRALVLGSRWPENAPLVVSEARRAGCPVIAPALGGLPELVQEGRDGWLYPPGDVEALARTMAGAVDAPLARAPRLPPSLDEQLDATLACYAAALDGRAAP